MKKLRIMMMLLASCALAFTSCKPTPDPEPTPTPKEITLNVAGGTSVVVEGSDVTKDITVTASSAPENDVQIKFASDAAAGEAAFENEIVTLKSGTTTVTGKITFKADKFPEGTAEKAIKVTISTSSSDVKMGTDNTTFKVSGANGEKMVKLSATAEKTEFDTTDEPQTAVITITLEKALDADLLLKGEILEESTIPVEKLAEMVMEPADPADMVIKAGETTMTIKFTLPKETKGTLAFGNFSTENKGVSIETQKLSFTFTYEEDPGPQPGDLTPLCEIASASLQPDWGYLTGYKIGETTNNSVDVGNGYVNMISTVVDIANGGALQILGSNKDTGGAQDVYGQIWIDWNNDGQLSADETVLKSDGKFRISAGGSNEMVAEGTLAAPTGTQAGKYSARIGIFYQNRANDDTGCATYESASFADVAINFTGGGDVPQPTGYVASIATADELSFTLGETAVTRTYTVSLDKAAEAELDVEMELTSPSANGASIDPTIATFAAGETSVTVTLTVNNSVFVGSAETAEVKVALVSLDDDISVSPTAKELVFTANKEGATPPVQKEDLNVTYYINDPYSGELIFTQGETEPKRISLILETSNDKKATNDVTFTPSITGLSESDYILDKPTATIRAGAEYTYYDMYINPSAVGKDCIISFTSDNATISADQQPESIAVKKAVAPSEPADVKAAFKVDDKTTITELKLDDWYGINFSGTNGEIPEGSIITPVVTGTLSLDDFYFDLGNPIIVKEGTSGYLQIHDSAKGKSGKLTFTSEYITFANDAGVTFDFTAE